MTGNSSRFAPNRSAKVNVEGSWVKDRRSWQGWELAERISRHSEWRKP